ncbi:MAG: branched-chain amino acid ABC transporter permease [Phycisphaerae bacterium]|mgnify:CR=1 FL=1|jgi:branched-chain amino acid transport system permease protein|nr:MAG: branched-chain amino acid ABC transporter permease [Phycisphaerae bacterium]
MTTLFIQSLLDALTLGALYALIALGYTMVYGVLGFINFAHSDVFAIGAWTGLLTSSLLGLSIVMGSQTVEPRGWEIFLVIPAAVLVCGLLAWVIQRLAYAPLRDAPRLNVLITAIGVSLLLQNVGQLPWVFGTDPRPMPRLIENPLLFEIQGVQVTLLPMLTIVAAMVLMVGLEVLIFHTRFGRAMRAVSMNPKVASLMGIPVDRVIDGTFVLGGALAGAAGVLFAMEYPTVQQPASNTWVLLGLKAFIAAVIGGIGNIRGAMVGGFLIAFLERFGAAAQQFFPGIISFDTTVYRDVYCFAILIVILLVRPAGLFGRSVVEKV